MPELPEVETVCRGLNETLVGQQLCGVESSGKKLRSQSASEELQGLLGKTVKRVRRRAKYLIIDLSDEVSLLNHLGMSGSWRIDDLEKLHDHLVLSAESGQKFRFNDPRRFGMFEVHPTSVLEQTKWLAHLGPEPLDVRSFTGDYLKSICRSSKAPIKNLLMNQKNVVGVGNIYVCEALFLSNIRPTRRAGKVTLAECDLLVSNIRKVLRQAIKAGGTTIRDFRQTGGEVGYFQNKLFVYGREGKDCLVCNKKIANQTLAGRSTFFCRSCQKR